MNFTVFTINEIKRSMTLQFNTFTMVSLYWVHKSIMFLLYFILVELLPFKMSYESIATRIELAHKAPDFSLDEVSRSPKLTKMYVSTYHMHMNEITQYNLST